jgi:peptide/nickel transport system permease protein
MIPTLFGITVVSFCIMQLAPGDPLLMQLGSGGAAGQSSQTREAYLIQRRDLRLDKPLILNFNYFRDYTERVRWAAYYAARSPEEVAADLESLAALADDDANSGPPDQLDRLAFLRSLEIEDFRRRLNPRLPPADPAERRRALLSLAKAVQGYVQARAEDWGDYGVPAAMALLRSPDTTDQQKIGLFKVLNFMVVEALKPTYSRVPTAEETPLVLAVWRTWFERQQEKLPKLEADRIEILQQQLATMVAAPSRLRLFELIENEYLFSRPDMRFFAEKLLGESSLREKEICAIILNLYVPSPMLLDAPLGAPPERVAEVTANWLAQYEVRKARYEPSFAASAWYIIADTQYSHMVVRLATFNFGRSALRSREPVSERLWHAVLHSAPLMLLAEVLIYAISVPTGVICAVNRGNPLDRLISLKLFLLYSIPPFVAGMMFLLFFCYGEYYKIFPMSRLHSEGAENFGHLEYLWDYLWHATLPVVCLSLFSLAVMAMYARTSMLDAINQDYIRTARAKGLSNFKVIFKHALRNSLIPVITLFANFLPAMLGGSVLVEYLFDIPGMGRLSFTSIQQKDFPTLMALIYIDAIVVLCSILLVDLLYVLVDPRITFEGRGKAA